MYTPLFALPHINSIIASDENKEGLWLKWNKHIKTKLIRRILNKCAHLGVGEYDLLITHLALIKEFQFHNKNKPNLITKTES